MVCLCKTEDGFKVVVLIFTDEVRLGVGLDDFSFDVWILVFRVDDLAFDVGCFVDIIDDFSFAVILDAVLIVFISLVILFVA